MSSKENADDLSKINTLRLNSGIPELLKTFLEGGLNTVVNSKLKGLSGDFQQNAISMSEVILRYGTETEKQTLSEIYHSCLNRVK